MPAADPEPAWRPWPGGLSADAVYRLGHHPLAQDVDVTIAGRLAREDDAMADSLVSRFGCYTNSRDVIVPVGELSLG